jgi:signal transduction histidine kinase
MPKGRREGAVPDPASLRAAREHATAIVEAVPTPLVVIDRGLQVRTANQAFRTMFGSALLGRSLLDLGEWRSPVLRDRIAAAFDTGERFDELEVGFVGPSGERTLRLGSRALPGASDRGLLLLGISDLTEQRRAENARKLAAAEHDAFLDAVSHELRTPLSAILLWGQALRELPADDPGRPEAVEAIIESAQAEAHLVDDLLELSLSRSGELTVAPEPIDAMTVLEPAVAALRKDAADKRIQIETSLPKSAPVNADPRRLRQIVKSLFGNALKFTPAGGTVAITVDLDSHAMELRVRDSGDGIPQEFLAYVFDSFSQVDRSTTRSHRGLGIGLALVRHFVVRQGGTIEVASAGRGQGTTFTVRLPLLGFAST